MLLICVQLLGGLGLFIAGMNMMTRGIEKVAGNSLRRILEAFTKTRLLGVLVGTFFTAMIQSSSAATVMVVSFVNSGLMHLSEASGVILGANIGTTVTAMLVAFKLSAVAPLFIFAGAIMVNYVKAPVARKSGEILLGFGVLFLGISTMSAAMTQLREIPGTIELLARFTNPLLGFALGLIITSVVQSSSVTVSILVVMGSQGLIGLDICMFVILGCNVGSCTTALLAAIGGSKNAQRAAWIHMLFNVFGTALMFTLLMLFKGPIEEVIYFFSGHGTDEGTLGRNIAWAHFLFKTFQVLALYPFMDAIVRLTYRIVPGEDEHEGRQFALQFISSGLPKPTVAIYDAVQEMERMAHMAFDNLNRAVDCLIDGDTQRCTPVFETERYIDYLDQEISSYLVKINQNSLPIEDANLIAAYFHVVSDIERIGDHAENIVEFVPQMAENGVRMSDTSAQELRAMMALINRILEQSLHMFVTGDATHMQEIRHLEDEIDQMERALQTRHIRRLSEGKCSAQAGIYFSDIVSGLERVGDHAINIAFALVEAHEGINHHVN
ncbi:MAG: Na/Pi cotransporter family protein [Candidatus Ventricola sp.]